MKIQLFHENNVKTDAIISWVGLIVQQVWLKMITLQKQVILKIVDQLDCLVDPSGYPKTPGANGTSRTPHIKLRYFIYLRICLCTQFNSHNYVKTSVKEIIWRKQGSITAQIIYLVILE